MILVMNLAGSCGDILPVRKSTMPAGVFSNQMLASHWLVVAASLRSARARLNVVATVLALAICLADLSLHTEEASRQMAREKSKARLVSSAFQTLPSHRYHLPQEFT